MKQKYRTKRIFIDFLKQQNIKNQTIGSLVWNSNDNFSDTVYERLQ